MRTVLIRKTPFCVERPLVPRNECLGLISKLQRESPELYIQLLGSSGTTDSSLIFFSVASSVLSTGAGLGDLSFVGDPSFNGEREPRGRGMFAGKV